MPVRSKARKPRARKPPAESDAKKAPEGVLANIESLKDEMAALGSRTLGEHLARIDPGEARLRARWTARSMYLEEFDHLWEFQSRFRPTLYTETLRRRLRHAIFHQRPLKSQTSLIGSCSLENGGEYVNDGRSIAVPKRRRMPLFFLDAQRFRLLQRVNDLRYRAPAASIEASLSPSQLEAITRIMGDADSLTASKILKELRAPEYCVLSIGNGKEAKSVKRAQIESLRLVRRSYDEPRKVPAERLRQLADELERHRDLTMTQVKRVLGLDPDGRLNLEAGGEKNLKGNQTNAAFLEIFGDRWSSLDRGIRDGIVLELWGLDSDETLRRRVSGHEGPWRTLAPDGVESRKVMQIRVPQEYLDLSRVAVRKLLPLMEAGVPYATARLQVYGRPANEEPRDILPPVHEVLGDPRNPVVSRVLTELRRVVNLLVGLYGKPSFIRVELARNLKATVRERWQIARDMRDREKEREDVRTRIRNEGGLESPRASDIEKALLFEECGGICPYTGKQMSFARLFGPHPEFDIEHIIPFSISQDDSFANKTLCHAEFNRNQKTNRTPWQTFQADPEGWKQAVQRMGRNIARGMSERKLGRFALQDDELASYLDEFRSRQLNDTRYASRMAMKYLASLFGGDLEMYLAPPSEDDPTARMKRRVQAGTGQVTAILRRAWGMSRALHGQDFKTRNDHRHHAIDAVAVALAGPAIVKSLSDDSQRAWSERRRPLSNATKPWTTFEADLDAAMQKLVVSHRRAAPVRGALHEETNYSPPRDDHGARLAAGTPDDFTSEESWAHVRKPLHSLSKPEVEAIVDPRIRTIVEAALAAGGSDDPKDVFDPKNPDSYPRLPSKSGRSEPIIRRVRIRKVVAAIAFGKGHRTRYAANSENHHLALYEITKKGKAAWAAVVVRGYEAMARRRTGLPIVSRESTPERRFLFSITKRDALEIDDRRGSRRLVVIKGISPLANGSADIEATGVSDAGTVPSKKSQDGGYERLRFTPSSLRDRQAMKVEVDAIGRLRTSHA